mmetsp:Transcript_24225/g.56979  ORF Transcript_24225/g.56979 Transcript_24225/m.56979 type:complete len:213 (-) Transcript_24225:451-1089(-)
MLQQMRYEFETRLPHGICDDCSRQVAEEVPPGVCDHFGRSQGLSACHLGIGATSRLCDRDDGLSHHISGGVTTCTVVRHGATAQLLVELQQLPGCDATRRQFCHLCLPGWIRCPMLSWRRLAHHTAPRHWMEARALGELIRVGQEPSTHCVAQEPRTLNGKNSLRFHRGEHVPQRLETEGNQKAQSEAKDFLAKCTLTPLQSLEAADLLSAV